jgi:hypothetical protein
MKTYSATIAFDTSVYGSFDFEAPDDATAIEIARREARSADKADDVSWDQSGNRVCQLTRGDDDEILCDDVIDPYERVYLSDDVRQTLAGALDAREAERVADVRTGDLTATEGKTALDAIKKARALIDPAIPVAAHNRQSELDAQAKREQTCLIENGQHRDTGRGVCADCGAFLID